MSFGYEVDKRLLKRSLVGELALHPTLNTLLYYTFSPRWAHA